MKNKWVMSSIPLIMCAWIFACSSKSTPSSENKNVPQTLAPGFKWHQENTPSFKIAYPENWTVVPKEEMQLGENQTGWTMIKENPNGPSASISLMIFSKYDFDAVKKNATHVQINGRDAYWTEVPMFTGKQKAVFLEANGQFFILQCTAPAEIYDSLKPTFETSINSLSTN